MEIESQNRHNDEAAIPMQEIKPSRNGQNADPYIALKYTDVNYSVSKRPKLCFGPKKVKQILKDLNGSFYEGELVALMGPSGAGKTTFLHVLSGQYMAGKLEGEIKIHGKTRTWKNKHKFRHHCAYVAQDDTLFSNLTTMETFTFASRLRLPREMSAAKKHERVMQVVDDLSLSRALPTFVGTPGVPGGVSGGERKRVSIGAEMIHDPNLVFLDEPTSGLDSWTARSVIQNLKFLTSTRNKTIVVTIHQPSTDVFNLFDKLVILARGDMIYNGRTDNVINYFAGIGYQCPTFVNPSEFIMDLVQPGFGVDPNQAREEKAVSRESHAKAEKISKEYVQTEDDIKTTERINQLISNYKESDMPKVFTTLTKEHTTNPPQMQGNKNFWPVETFILLHRAMLQTARDKENIISKVMQMLFQSFLAGFVFLQLGNDQTSIQDRQGLLFYCIMSSFMPFLMNIITMFPKERRVFFKEYSNGAYGSLSYYISKIVSEFPFNIVYPMIFAIPIYFMADLNMGADHFFIFYAVCLLVALNANALGLMISTGQDSLELLNNNNIDLILSFSSSRSRHRCLSHPRSNGHASYDDHVWSVGQLRLYSKLHLVAPISLAPQVFLPNFVKE
eukprot:TRINITY_DN578_c0_g2_i1.p1 TRINITY_DN578_c0_g2~~TRINITY_DN578_c0_g2_i1.p1  ORF type:complete len:617 (-),score=196.94 TRINITY_DN578_c0_g2_i1:156-2006(-)